MAGKDIIAMSQKELKRLHVMSKVIEGSLTQRQAAEFVSLSERQIRRIVRRIDEEGERGVQHRSRGKEPNNKLFRKLTERIARLYRQKYQGFGPTLTVEKLLELDGISVSKETVRTLLIGTGQWETR